MGPAGAPRRVAQNIGADKSLFFARFPHRPFHPFRTFGLVTTATTNVVANVTVGGVRAQPCELP